MQLYWTTPASNSPPVASYEVFYAASGSDNAESGGTTPDTNISITLSTLDVTYYSIFVVAFSDAPNTLPSTWSSIITVIASKSNY